MAATPRPWRVQGEPNGFRIHAEGHGQIAVCVERFMDREQRLENARLIVRSVNLHDELVAALRLMLTHNPCTCGARIESLDTHSHVIGCPIGKVMAQLEEQRT